jgi:hypothetical protein
VKDGAGIEPAAADAAAALLRHEARAHQHLDVARHRLQRNVERRSELGDQQILLIQPVEYRAADGVGKRAEHLVEDLIFGLRLIHEQIISKWPDDNQ